ncbi:MAG TPA: carbohydrate kinase family protein [Terracidiphilus sp.]|nr:carbohydrate kinase family protein [Terracidiphilus sp.]
MTQGLKPPAHTARRFDVTIAGDANFDLLLYGLPEHMELERELLANDMALCIGGSGAITAHNLSALGRRVGFTLAAADDEFGRLSRAQLQGAGVDLSSCVSVAGERTGVTVHVQHQATRHMLTYAGATFHLRYEDLNLTYLADSRHFHMPSYYLQSALTPHIPALFAELKRAGVTLSLDPNDDPAHMWAGGIEEALRLVDMLMPNEREACLLAKETTLERAIEKLRRIVPLLIVKRGAAGSSAYCGDEEWHASAHPVNMLDAVGAGDSFNAGFLHAWLEGWPLEKALAYANLIGAWSTKARGGTAAFQQKESLKALADVWAENAVVQSERFLKSISLRDVESCL